MIARRLLPPVVVFALEPPTGASASTVVSLTFDDGLATQYDNGWGCRCTSSIR